MYKKVFKNIQKNINKKEDLTIDIFKNSEKKLHSIHDKQPHFIFSSENPLHPAKINMSHEDTIEFLNNKGYETESIDGKYGEKERSILVHSPPKHTHRHLMDFARNLGQDSAIVSDGNDHEMHYLNGEKDGMHHKGKGTVVHQNEPHDYYSTLGDGTHFSHSFDFDKLHNESDMIKTPAGSMKKSEDFIYNGVYKLAKAEGGPKHKLELAGAGTKLVHYSPQEGLGSIDPEHHGVRKIGSEAKQGAPKHKMNFYYAEGVEPEDIVTSGSKSKYVVDLGDKKLYDIAKDHHGLREKATETAQNAKNEYYKSKGWAGQMMVSSEEIRDHYHQAIKDKGYHGIYNSSLNDTMSHAVGMFDSMKPEAEHKIHPNDFKETSAKNHHAMDEHKNQAKSFADETGHHNHEFLHHLTNSFED